MLIMSITLPGQANQMDIKIFHSLGIYLAEKHENRGKWFL